MSIPSLLFEKLFDYVVFASSFGFYAVNPRGFHQDVVRVSQCQRVTGLIEENPPASTFEGLACGNSSYDLAV